MINLIYTSKAATPYSLNDINFLLAECRLKNTFFDITGILLYHQGSIMQILEGEEETVNTVFNKIKIDTRHHDVLKIGSYKIDDRNYTDWSMAFKEISDTDWSTIEACLFYKVTDRIYPPTTLMNSYIINLIDSFLNVSRL